MFLIVRIEHFKTIESLNQVEWKLWETLTEYFNNQQLFLTTGIDRHLLLLKKLSEEEGIIISISFSIFSKSLIFYGFPANIIVLVSVMTYV